MLFIQDNAKEMVSQYGNRSRLDPKHGITAMTDFSPKTGTMNVVSQSPNWNWNWNPYNEKERERYRQEGIPGSVLQSTSVHLKFPLV